MRRQRRSLLSWISPGAQGEPMNGVAKRAALSLVRQDYGIETALTQCLRVHTLAVGHDAHTPSSSDHDS